MLEAFAFLMTLSHLEAFRRREMFIGWSLCLLACILWFISAWRHEMLFFGLQQLTIGGMAINGIWKERRTL
jgi:hypothetical protein